MLLSNEDFKAYVGLNSNDFDEVIDVLISGAVKWIEIVINNKITEGEGVEYFDGDEIVNEIFLSNNLNLKELTVEYESDGNWIMLPGDDYVFYDDQGVVKLDYVKSGERNYKVSYKAGFTDQDVPDDLKLAILKLTGRLWNKRKSDGIKMEELADASVDWESQLTPEITAVLNKYKRYIL